MRLPAVLMYHHVHTGADAAGALHPDSYLDPAELDRHLDWLARRRFATLTFAEALTTAPPSRRSVVLTFDDGCVCFRDTIAPALRRRGQRATLFAVSGRLGGANTWDTVQGERTESLLGAQDLVRLAAEGMEIGCHGRTHADLTDDADLDSEVAGGKVELEDALGGEVRTFCYPYGAVDARARGAIEDAGFLGAASIFGHPGACPRDRFAVARMIVRPGESDFELGLKVRGLYPSWNRFPSVGLLRRLRARSGRRAGRA